MRKRWQRLRQAGDLAELNRLANKINEITRKYQAMTSKTYIMGAVENDNSLWKVGRRLKSSKNFENMDYLSQLRGPK